MIYCYRCPDCGKRDEQNFPMGKAPENVRCGACGEAAERDFAGEGDKVNSAYQTSTNQYPYVSNRLPRNLDGCQTDKKGRPVILSQTHEREVARRHGYTRD